MDPHSPADGAADAGRYAARSTTWLDEIHAFAAAAGAGELRIFTQSPYLVLLAERAISDPTALALGAYIGAILRQHCEVRPLPTLPAWRRTQDWAGARPLQNRGSSL